MNWEVAAGKYVTSSIRRDTRGNQREEGGGGGWRLAVENTKDGTGRATNDGVGTSSIERPGCLQLGLHALSYHCNPKQQLIVDRLLAIVLIFVRIVLCFCVASCFVSWCFGNSLFPYRLPC